MTSNPPQILPQTIFHATGESTLCLVGILLCKKLCWDGFCLFAVSSVCRGECRCKEFSFSQLTAMTHGGRERSITVVIFSSAYSQWTCRLSSYKSSLFPMSPWSRHPDQQRRQKPQRTGITVSLTHPTTWQIFICQKETINITAIGSNVTGRSSRSQEGHTTFSSGLHFASAQHITFEKPPAYILIWIKWTTAKTG